MTGYYDRPVSPLGDWSLFLARLALVMFVIAGLAHRYGLMETVGFFWVLGFICLLAITALVIALLAFQRLWRAGARGGRAAAAGLILSLIVLAPFAVSAWRAAALPALNDISTDRSDPPRFFIAPGLRGEGQNEIATPSPQEIEAAARAYPAATGRRYDAAPDRVLRAVTNVMADNRWQVLSRKGVPQETPELLVEARASTFFFAFPVDVVVRISDEDESTYVDMRSASVFARHDLGDNARRIEAFMNALDAEMLTLAGT